jgi:hypothetical protein
VFAASRLFHSEEEEKEPGSLVCIIQMTRPGTGPVSLSVWPCGPPWRVGKHKEAQTAIVPSQSPSRSLETARPVGRASALDPCPGAKVLGPQTERDGLREAWGPLSNLAAALVRHGEDAFEFC